MKRTFSFPYRSHMQSFCSPINSIFIECENMHFLCKPQRGKKMLQENDWTSIAFNGFCVVVIDAFFTRSLMHNLRFYWKLLKFYDWNIVANNFLLFFLLFPGPVTVPMVSQSGSPPIPMPVQVPPGHVMQQIVDENGTLRHVILSTQHQQMQGGIQGVQHQIHGHYVSLSEKIIEERKFAGICIKKTPALS